MQMIFHWVLPTIAIFALSASVAQASTGVQFSSSGPITATGRLTINASTICPRFADVDAGPDHDQENWLCAGGNHRRSHHGV